MYVDSYILDRLVIDDIGYLFFIHPILLGGPIITANL